MDSNNSTEPQDAAPDLEEKTPHLEPREFLKQVQERILQERLSSRELPSRRTRLRRLGLTLHNLYNG